MNFILFMTFFGMYLKKSIDPFVVEAISLHFFSKKLLF